MKVSWVVGGRKLVAVATAAHPHTSSPCLRSVEPRSKESSWYCSAALFPDGYGQGGMRMCVLMQGQELEHCQVSGACLKALNDMHTRNWVVWWDGCRNQFCGSRRVPVATIQPTILGCASSTLCKAGLHPELESCVSKLRMEMSSLAPAEDLSPHLQSSEIRMHDFGFKTVITVFAIQNFVVFAQIFYKQYDKHDHLEENYCIWIWDAISFSLSLLSVCPV